MAIPKEQILHIANLAKLEIDESDSDRLSTKLGGILDLVDKMQNYDTQQIEPMAHPIEQSQILRPDLDVAIDNREEIQNLAPQIEDYHYIVPKVIE